MDDLVVLGAAGIIMLFFIAVALLIGAFSLGGLMYAAFISKDFGVIVVIASALLVIGSLYIATGIWLRQTERI